MTRVVHCKREPYDVYIGRGRCPKTGQFSKWGNWPFSHKESSLAATKVDSRAAAIYAYYHWLLTKPELLTAIPLELKDKTLGCWCVPSDCHGHVLAAMADGTPLPDFIVDWEKYQQAYGVKS